MDKKLFNKIINSCYSNFISFAVWNEDDVRDISVIKNNIDCLNKNIIIVGLNTNGLVEKFKNFHYKGCGGRDVWLKEVFNRSVFRGAYMTDIIKNDNSSSRKDVNLTKENKIKNAHRFKEELQFIECENPYIIVMGDDAYEIILEYLPEYKNNVQKIPHYAKRGIKKEQFIKSIKKLEIIYKIEKK